MKLFRIYNILSVNIIPDLNIMMSIHNDFRIRKKFSNEITNYILYC